MMENIWWKIRKWSDQSLHIQGVGRILLVICLFTFLAVFANGVRFAVMRNGWHPGYRDNLWGFKLLADPGAMCSTIDQLDDYEKESHDSRLTWILLVVVVSSGVLGIVIVSIFTGTIVSNFERRAENVRDGRTRYRFKGHGVIIGWDFQGQASIDALFNIYGCSEVVILSEQPKANVLNEIDNEFGEKWLRRVYIYNGSVGVEDDLRGICAEDAKCVIVLGDQNEMNNDGGNMSIARRVRERIDKVRGTRSRQDKVNLLVDITNPYNYRLYEVFPYEVAGPDSQKNVDVRIMNFCRTAIAELYSSFTQFRAFANLADCDKYASTYYPLAFRRNPESTHVHLIFTDLTDMAMAGIFQLLPIIGMGREEESSRRWACSADCERDMNVITVFHDSSKATLNELIKFKSVIDRSELKRLLNIDVRFRKGDICDETHHDYLKSVAQDMSASVTLFVVDARPDAALAKFNLLPDVLRYENVRVLVEQRILSKWAPSIRTLNCTGFNKVDFFGFTDRYYQSFKTVDVLLKSLDRATKMTPRQRIYRESVLLGALEFLSSQNLMLDYNPFTLPQWEVSIPESMIREEHIRNIGYKLLSGVRYATESDVFTNRSNELVEWSKLNPGVRAKYKILLRRVYSAVQEVFSDKKQKNKGDNLPYGLFKRHFIKVLGVMPTSEWHAKTEEQQLSVRTQLLGSILEPLAYDARRRNLKIVDLSKKKSIKFHKDHLLTQNSLAVLLVPGYGLEYDVCQTIYNMGIPVILLLNRQPKDYADELVKDVTGEEATRIRERFDRLLRNAFTYYVVEESRPDDLADFVATHSDELLWKSCDGKEDYPMAKDFVSERVSEFRWLPVRNPSIRHVLCIGKTVEVKHSCAKKLLSKKRLDESFAWLKKNATLVSGCES